MTDGPGNISNNFDPQTVAGVNNLRLLDKVNVPGLEIDPVRLPKHGTSFEAMLDGLPPKTLLFMTDNGKMFHIPSQAYGGSTDTGGWVGFGLDHHVGPDMMPLKFKGLVSSQLVLHPDIRNSIIDYANIYVKQRGYNPVIIGHGSPLDPDAVISAKEIRDILLGKIGKGDVPDIYKKLADYANVTDFYKFPFGNKPEYTLRGILDGLFETYKDQPDVLAKKCDDVLNWVIENKLDPNKYDDFAKRVSEGTVPEFIDEGIKGRQNSTKLVNDALVNTSEIEVRNEKGELIPLKVVVIDDSKVPGKAIDDRFYNQKDQYLIIKKTDGQWWVSVRPSEYSLGDGVNRTDPKFDFTKEIVSRLPKFNWAKWPYSATMIEDPRVTKESLMNAFHASSIPEKVSDIEVNDQVRKFREEGTRDNVAGFNKASSNADVERYMKEGLSFTDYVFNTPLKGINDRDIPGVKLTGHERGNEFLKQTEKMLVEWFHNKGVDAKVYREGATFTVRVLGEKPANIDLEAMGIELSSVNIEGIKVPFKPKIGSISYDPGTSRIKTPAEYIAFASGVVNQVNDGKTGVFEPKGKIQVREPRAQAYDHELINKIMSDVKELFPTLSETQLRDIAIDRYKMMYIEPDSGLPNAEAFAKDYDREVALGKKCATFFFDGDKFSAWKNSYGTAFGNKAMEKILFERVFNAGRNVFDKYGITIYRHGSRSEEFYLLGEVDMETMNKAVAEFGEALNKPLLHEIPVKDIKNMPQAGKELINDYIRNNPGSVKDGKITVDLTIMLRGINAKFSGITVTGSGAMVEIITAPPEKDKVTGENKVKAQTWELVQKEAEAQKTANKNIKRDFNSMISYMDRGAPAGTLAYKAGGTVYSSARDGLTGFLVEAPFSALHQLVTDGTFSGAELIKNMKDSGIGWAEFGALKGAGQSLLNLGPTAAVNFTLVLQTLSQLESASPEQRAAILAGGGVNLAGFIRGAELFNLIPGPAWLKGIMKTVGGVAGAKVSSEAFAYAYQTYPAFRNAVNSRVMQIVANAGAAGSNPMNVYFGTQAASNVIGYGIRDAAYLLKEAGKKEAADIIAKAGEKVLFFTIKAGVVTTVLTFPGLPLNPSSVGGGNYDGSVVDYANCKGTIKCGDEVFSPSMDISSDVFERLFSEPAYNHAPRMAIETAVILKQLGYFRRSAELSDDEWKDFNKSLETGTLDKYLGGILHENRRSAFISEIRDGIEHFQKDCVKRGIKVDVGKFDAQTVRLLVLAYDPKIQR